MGCPFLTPGIVPSCLADNTLYAPGIFELEKYCRSARHCLCPFYCAKNDDKYPVMKHLRSGVHKG